MFCSHNQLLKSVGILAGIALLGSVSSIVVADTIVAGSADKKVHLFMPDGTSIVDIPCHNGAVLCSAIHTASKIAATGGADKKVKLWNTTNGMLINEIDAHDGSVTSVAFSEDGKKLYTGGTDKKVKIWTVATGKIDKTIDCSGPLIQVLTVQEMTIAAVNDGEGKVSIFGADGSSVFEIPTAHTGGLTAMAGNPKAQMVYTGGADGKLKYWAQSGPGDFEGVQGGAITGIFVFPDGKKILTSGANGQVKTWDADTHKIIATMDKVHEGSVTCVCASPDGKLIITGGADKKVKLWDATGKLVKTLDKFEGAVTYVMYEADPKKEDKAAEVKKP